MNPLATENVFGGGGAGGAQQASTSDKITAVERTGGLSRAGTALSTRHPAVAPRRRTPPIRTIDWNA